MAKQGWGYDRWYSDACFKGGDGQCDGYIPANETNTGTGYSGIECDCLCHEFDATDAVTVTDYELFHKEMWSH